MEWDLYEYDIAEQFASAIINDDHSGLDDADEAALNAFMANLPKVAGHWSIEGENDEYFSRCEVTGLMAFCVTACLHFRA